MGLQSLCSQFYYCHILVRIDNVTAVSYINNTGDSHSRFCHWIARDGVLWAKERRIWLSTTHAVGKDNSKADFVKADLFQSRMDF